MSLLVTAAAVPAVAIAQTAPSSSSGAAATYPDCKGRTVTAQESERAHAMYAAGRIQYDDKNYEAAIQQFREAYNRDCTKHDLLVIISAAYERKFDLVEAVRALKLYLERVPNSPDRQTHERQIANLEKIIAQQQASAPPPPPSASTTATTAPPPPAREERHHTVFPWIMTGIGVVGMGVGAVLLVAAPATPPNCDSSTTTCTRKTDAAGNPIESQADVGKDQDTATQAANMTLAGIITLAGGAVVAVGGLIWHFAEPTGPREANRRPTITPALAPGYAGMNLGGTF